MAVIIETSVGELTVDLYAEERPRCTKNFLKLCKVKYYNFSLFHSIQQNLVAQTGDPTATGRGGMSVYGMVYGEQARFFDMELTPRIKHKKRGQLSMVNNGNGKHGSQFFITLGTDLDYLDGEHTVFGEVAEGFEVLDKLNEAYCDENHRPYRDIRIFHTVILDDPFDDPEGLVIPDKSPGPTQEMLESDRIGVDEEVDDTKGMTEQEVEELQAEREAKANAQLLEMVGDIPDADVKPPDNVLFVCKLNPVTTDEDLEMIFSRFGPIVSCEVIKDHKTKESLQYAFVEFEKPEDCENAYFKMDNVLIDDRRIHVDFSQSVSKLRYPASGKKVEEEKKEDQPRYVLKDRQRRDNNYDLVFEHDDLADNASPEPKKSSQPKHQKHTDSPQDGDAGDKRKKSREAADRQSRSRSREAGERDRRRRQSPSPQQERRKEEKKRDRKASSSEEESRKERRKERRSPSSEEDRRMEKRKKKLRSSPSPDEDRRKERRKKHRSPSSDEDRRKEKRRKNRSPSAEKDGRKDRRNKPRSPSSEEDRRKERRNKARSPSSDEEEHRQRRKERRASPPEEDREKKRHRRRSASPEEKSKKEKNKRERSGSPDEDRKKKKKKKKESRRRSSSCEEDHRKERKKEEGRREHSSSSHRDRRDRR